MFQASDNVLLILLLVILKDAAVHSEVITCVSEELKSMAWKPCKFPESDGHYYLSFNGTTKFNPKTDELEGNGQQAVQVKCYDLTKQSKAPDLVVCFDGEWYPSNHECVPKACDPVHNTHSTIFTCTTPTGRNVSCNQPNPINTEITIWCSHWRYINPNKNSNRKLCVDGKWGKLDTCRAECGKVGRPPAESKVTMSEKALYENPWHVLIYRLQDKKWTQRCVGTILNSRVIITAGSCFFFPPIFQKPESVKVSVGQYYRDFETSQLSSRIYNVLDVYIRFNREIALIKTDTYIEYNDTVGSACFADNWYANDQPYMAILKEDNKTGSTSKGTELLWFVSNDECQSLEEVKGQQLQHNQFCAVSGNGNKFNPTNIGAGFMIMVRVRDPRKPYQYYLKGILTNSTANGKVLTFIDISKDPYHKFINGVLELNEGFDLSGEP